MKRRSFLAASAIPLVACQQADDLSHIQGSFTGINQQRGHLLRELGNAGKGGKSAKSGQRLPTPAITRRTRVLIAGGGVAGLAAARALRLRGLQDFALLELEDSAGGNSRAGAVNGIACPLGAHYLPVPGDSASEVQDLLEELGLRQRVAGRWVYDERSLCHSPQERLFIHGQWQDGLLPMLDVDATTLADYQRFASLVQTAASAAKYTIPVSKSPLVQQQRALDAMVFEAWLNQQQLHSPALRWYLDYCCRDDYGAGIATVSAWAGIHYFASRHGFSAPGSEPPAEREAGVLTWPEGNGWLTRQLAGPLGERLKTGHVVLRIAAGKHGVEIDALNTRSQQTERWLAEHCVLALPLFVAARVLENPPPALLAAARSLRYAPWLVANIHIRAALRDHPGAAPSWDNVIYSPGATGAAADALGYVDAGHQNLIPVPGATVLSHYRSFGLAASARQALYELPWSHWRDTLMAELSVPHPDLPAKVSQIDITRYGHAMAMPTPGQRSHPALLALQQKQPAPWQRLQFAHSDLSAYSVFEEAFTHGHVCGGRVGL